MHYAGDAVPTVGARQGSPDAESIVDFVPAEAFDRLIRLAAESLRAPAALFSVVEEERVVFKSQLGLPEPWASRREAPPTHAFCPLVAYGGRPLAFDDARDHRLADPHRAAVKLGMIAYAGVPVRWRGRPVGVLAVADGARRSWQDAQLQLLQDLAETAAAELELAARAGLTDEAEAADVAHASAAPSATETAATPAADSRTGSTADRPLLDAIGRLAGGVAHDFNSLLTAIQGRSHLALEELEPDSPIRVHLNEIRAAAERATELTRQLLAFGRKQVLRPRTLDVRAVLSALYPILRRAVGEKTTLVTEFGSGDCRILVDPDRFRQVVLALVVNARDAMPEGGRITIAAHPTTHDADPQRPYVAPGEYVGLTIADTGEGIEGEAHERIFEPFYSTKQPGTGAGLGLSSVYGIVRQSGGHIWVESEAGRGTTVRLYFPAASAAAESTAGATDTAEAAKTTVGEVGAAVESTMQMADEVETVVDITETPTDEIEMVVQTTESAAADDEAAYGTTEAPDAPATILLVDDEEAVRSLVRRILEKEGYRVATAANGQEALRRAYELDRPIGLLLTDVVMPGMSGSDLAARLSERFPALRVLYMSGYMEDEVVHRDVASASAGFLPKPFSPFDLALAVRELFGPPEGPASTDG